MDRICRISEADLRTCMLLARRRQDDVRHVRPEDNGYAEYSDLDVKLEQMKVRLAKQLI